MEEYIKQVEDIISFLDDAILYADSDDYDMKKAQKDKMALKYLLKRYKELEEENKELVKNNYRLTNELENRRKEYQETYKDVREELKELKEKNERLIIAKAEALQEMRKYKAKAKDLKEKNKGLIESNKEWLRVYGELEEENKQLKDNYKNQIEHTTILAKALNLEEDAPIDEIYAEINKLKTNSIPTSVIQNKKSEIEKQLQEYEESDMEQDDDYFFDVNALKGEIAVLQELLEKGNN